MTLRGTETAHQLPGLFLFMLLFTSMLYIDNRYERVAPNGDVSIVFIKNREEQKYHEELSTVGYKYKEIRLSAPSDDICESCSG